MTAHMAGVDPAISIGMEPNGTRAAGHGFWVEFARHAAAAFGGMFVSAAVGAVIDLGRFDFGGALFLVAVVALPLTFAVLLYTVAVQASAARWQAFAWSPLIGAATLTPLAWGGAPNEPGKLAAVVAALAFPALLTAAVARPGRASSAP